MVTNLYPPHHYGGYELSCRDVVERWRSSGNDVHVLTSKTQLEREPSIDADRSMGVRRDLDVYMRGQRLWKPGWRERVRIERNNLNALQRALDEVTPDLVSVWHMSTLSLAMLSELTNRDIPVVYVVCDDWLIDAPGYDQWLRPFLRHRWLGAIARRITGLQTAVRAPSHASACYVSSFISDRARQLSKIPVQRSTIVYSGIDRADFPVRGDLDRPWTGRLLIVGRPDSRKGMHVAIDALPDIRDSILEIVGRGNDVYARSLIERAADRGVADRVRFSYAPRSELRHIYASADAFLFPVIWDEPFGLVPLEAMACGTPVIATGTGGSAEFLIDAVNCLLVPTRDPAALSSAIKRLRSDAALRRRLIAGGLATADVMNVDRLAADLLVWHHAASMGFVHGIPPHPPSPRERLAARGIDTTPQPVTP